MSGWHVQMIDTPSEWTERDRKPFRCGLCGEWCADGDGKWVSRGIGPGQFMAVHRECPRDRKRRWWQR